MADKYTLSIVGGGGVASVSRMEQALGKASGAIGATFDDETQSVSLRVYENQMDTDELVVALRQAGFDVLTQQVAFQVEGMNCISCVARVEGELSDVFGVINATVDLKQECVTVTFLPELTGIEKLREAIEKSGYEIPEHS